MSVRADWGLQALQDDDSAKVDPFGAASYASMFSGGQDGAPDWMFDVGLDTPNEEIERLLGLTTRTQNRLYNAGVDCPIRWEPGSSCLACPLSKANDPDDAPKCQLCRTSTQEESLLTVLAAKQSDGG